MKLGVCLVVDSSEGLEEKFANLSREGFHYCQLLSWNPADWTEKNAAIIRGCCDKYDITPSAFWCGWEGPVVWNFYEGQETLGLVPPTYRYHRMKNLMDGADFAHRLGITDVISHMGFIPENPYDPNFSGLVCALRAVADHLKANGQYLLFETGQETPTTMLRCFEQIGTDNLGVNLDTGNLILYGKANPVDALDTIGRFVRNIHAKDGLYPTNGHDLGQEVRLGDGKANWPALIYKLHDEYGYNGHVTIEREIDGAQQTEDIRYAKAYLEDLFAALDKGDASC